MRYSGEQWKVEKAEVGLFMRATTARHELHKGRVLLVKAPVAGTRKVLRVDEDGRVVRGEDGKQVFDEVPVLLGEVWECTRDGKDTPVALIDCNGEVYNLALKEVA